MDVSAKHEGNQLGGSVTLRHVAQQPRKVFEAAGVGRMMTID